MAQVPEKVLTWLFSVLQQYPDSQRTYSDAARTLSAYPSLSPRTEVYTYENGNSALLLTLSGILPVGYRGTTYRFPIKVWVPQPYPQEAPIVYVTPGLDMLIRPGQHVGVDGRVYHPYLRDWTRMWDRASIAEFMGFLQQVFAKEPPVVSKAQQQQYQRPDGFSPQQHAAANASPAPPILPPKQKAADVEQRAEMPGTDAPPPRPPKPGEEPDPALPSRTSSLRDISKDGPPLPPLPHEKQQAQQAHQYPPAPQYQNSNALPSRPASQRRSPQASCYPNGRPHVPPMPPLHAHPQYQQHQQHQQHRSNHDRSPVSPVSPVTGYSELPENLHSHPPHFPVLGQQHPNYHQTLYQRAATLQQPRRSIYQNQNYPNGPLQTPAGYDLNQPYHQSEHTQPRPPSKKAPPPDLLSDPFDVALPVGPVTNALAPPIPPNPEKEHILQALSTTLVQQAQAKINQNLSALAPLQAQQVALQEAYQRLEAELRQLEQLANTLDTNESILRRSIAECDATIEAAKNKKLPPIDEVLIAPTLVAQQLWNCCAEEASCREAMYVLQKALDRGRISGEVFVKQMRALGREAFTKMALARKCAHGLGLEVNGGGTYGGR